MEKLDRKDFLKLAGGTVAGAVAGGAAGFTLSGAPFQGVQWTFEWTQDQYAPPKGSEKFINSVYGTYPGGSQVSLRMIGDRAVKINSSEHNADAQLELQLLYHPERIQTPLKRKGKKGYDKFEEVSWEDAIKDIASRIDELLKKHKQDSIAAIDSGRGGLSSLLMERLIATAGSPNIYSETSFDSLSSKAVAITQNFEGSISYDLENSDYILTFGARIVEGWGDPVEIYRSIKTWKTTGAKMVHVDAMSTRTGCMADRWVPVKPGTESVLALGIANQLMGMRRSKYAKIKNFAAMAKMLEQYSPEEVSKITGVPAAEIKKLAEEFASASRPVAVAGRGSCEVSSTVAEISAVQCLNAIVNNFGNKGGVFVREHPGIGRIQRVDGGRVGIDDFIKNGKNIEILFINEADPVYKSVFGEKLIEMMQQVPMVVSIMPLKNGSAVYSDYILPSISSLEIENSEGQVPVAPRYKSKYSGDIIINIARKTLSLSSYFLWKDHNDAVKTMEEDKLTPVKDFIFPEKILKDHMANVKKQLAGSAEYPLTMIPFSLQGVGDGRGLAYPYVSKGIDDTILKENTLWVQMNPETADKNGLCEGSKIDVISARGKLKKLRVHLTKTVAPDVIAIPLGFGQAANTIYAAGKGVNPREIMSDDIDPVSGVADWWLTKVKIS